MRLLTATLLLVMCGLDEALDDGLCSVVIHSQAPCKHVSADVQVSIKDMEWISPYVCGL